MHCTTAALSARGHAGVEGVRLEKDVAAVAASIAKAGMAYRDTLTPTRPRALILWPMGKSYSAITLTNVLWTASGFLGVKTNTGHSKAR